MKKMIAVLSICCTVSVHAQNLQTVTTSGNTSLNALRVAGDANFGPSGGGELVLGVFQTIKANDTRAFIGWKNDFSTNTTTNGLAGSLLLQPRTNFTDMSVDFATGFITPALRMRIAGNGNVSIGDDSRTPASRLLIKGSGTTNATTSLLVQNSAGTQLLKLADNGITTISNTLTLAGTQQSPNYILANEYADNSQLLIKAGSTASVFSQIEVTGNWNGTVNTGGKIAFSTSGLERMRIGSGGEVGIGINSPATKLDIQTTAANDGINIRNSTTGFLRIAANSFQSQSYNLLTQAGDAGIVFGGANANLGTFGFVIAPWSTSMSGLRVSSGGNVSIGTPNALDKLHVEGGGIIAKASSGTIILQPSLGAIEITSGIAGNSGVSYIDFRGNANAASDFKGRIIHDDAVGFDFLVNGGTKVLTINNSGSVYCNNKMFIGAPDGTTAGKIASYSLAVSGDALIHRVKVKAYASWPDFVFEEKYNLLPLPELEQFIKTNKHLPEVASAADVEKDGIDLGDNQTVLLKKVEELTLYLIEQNKKIESLSSLVKTLEKQLDSKK